MQSATIESIFEIKQIMIIFLFPSFCHQSEMLNLYISFVGLKSSIDHRAICFECDIHIWPWCNEIFVFSSRPTQCGNKWWWTGWTISDKKRKILYKIQDQIRYVHTKMTYDNASIEQANLRFMQQPQVSRTNRKLQQECFHTTM